MRQTEYTLLLADIHANPIALTAVLNDVHKRYPGRAPLPVWFLGDLLGRGPDPVTAWDNLMDLVPQWCVVGNHDLGILNLYQNVWTGKTWTGPFNSDDWQVLLKHRDDLKQVGLLEMDGAGLAGTIHEELSRWSRIAVPQTGTWLVHGGVAQPLDTLLKNAAQDHRSVASDIYHRLVWDYVIEPKHAAATLETLRWLYENPTELSELSIAGASHTQPRVVIMGHYHRRTLYYGGAAPQWVYPVRLDVSYPLAADDRPVLFSPGSVGFPREDYDRDASYAVVGSENGHAVSVTFHTTPFDRVQVIEAMREKNYPPRVLEYLKLPLEPLQAAERHKILPN